MQGTLSVWKNIFNISRSGLYYGPVIELYDGQLMHLTDELYTSYEGLKSKPE